MRTRFIWLGSLTSFTTTYLFTSFTTPSTVCRVQISQKNMRAFKSMHRQPIWLLQYQPSWAILLSRGASMSAICRGL